MDKPDPMLCPWCGKCRNYDYNPHCLCRPFTLARVVTMDEHAKQWREDVEAARKERG